MAPAPAAAAVAAGEGGNRVQGLVSLKPLPWRHEWSLLGDAAVGAGFIRGLGLMGLSWLGLCGMGGDTLRTMSPSLSQLVSLEALHLETNYYWSRRRPPMHTGIAPELQCALLSLTRLTELWLMSVPSSPLDMQCLPVSLKDLSVVLCVDGKPSATVADGQPPELELVSMQQLTALEVLDVMVHSTSSPFQLAMPALLTELNLNDSWGHHWTASPVDGCLPSIVQDASLQVEGLQVRVATDADCGVLADISYQACQCHVGFLPQA